MTKLIFANIGPSVLLDKFIVRVKSMTSVSVQ